MIKARALNLAMVGAAAVLWLGCEGKQTLCSTDSECPGGACDREVGRCAAKSCSSDSECGPGLYCDRQFNVCFFIPDGGGVDGGGVDGGGVDGGVDGGVTCVPGCPEYQVCQGTVCVARYSGIDLLRPSNGQFIDGGGTPVTAQLNVASGFTRADPATLTLALGFPDGGAASGPLAIQDAGLYQGTFVPIGYGSNQLTVKYVDAGLASPTISVIADTVPPSFLLMVPTPIRSGPMYVDPAPGFSDAWRRDETFVLNLSSSDPYMLPSTVTLRVSGIPGAVSTLLNVTQTIGCGQPYCGTVVVDMSKPDMKAFRGTFGLVVTGQDMAGNVGSSDGGVHATRWKWLNQLTSNPIRTAPAIGSSGTIYVGSQNAGGTLGTVFALNTDGGQKWFLDGGAIAASPVVSVDAGIDRVYVAMNSGATNPTLYVMDGTLGIPSPIACTTYDGGSVSGPMALGVSLPLGSLQPVETAFMVVNNVNGGRLLAVRPDAIPAQQCRFVDNAGTVGTSTSAGGLAQNGFATYVGSDNSLSVKSYSLVSDALTLNWTVDAGYATHGLAITGGTLVAGGYGLAPTRGTLVTLPTDGGPVGWSAGDGGIPTWSPSVGSGNTIIHGDNNSRINSVIFNTDAGISVALPGGIPQGSPLVGRDGLIYVAATDFNLSVFDPALSLQWRIDLLAPVEGSLAIDCARTALGALDPGRPGILYVATSGGQVYALIADSLGLDINAPWPKYQHDPRNTGNSTTPLSSFACPP